MKISYCFLIFFLASLGLSACAGKGTTLVPVQTSTETPSAIPSLTPTFTPKPTLTSSPQPTSTKVPTATASSTPAQDFRKDFPAFVAFTQLTAKGPQVYTASFGQDEPKIFSMTETAGVNILPHWSHDGMYIAFLHSEPESEHVNFWMVDNTTGQVKPISTDGISIATDFCWTADNRSLVWAAVENDIYKIEIETGYITNLTPGSPVWDNSPSCSPMENSIAFVSDRSGSGKEMDNIWIMDSDGNELRQLTNTKDWENERPSWSPDGQEILFYRYNFFGGEQGGPAGIWATKVDGGGERLIFKRDDILPLGYDSPAWSPDGRFILFQTGLPEEAELYIFALDSGKATKVSQLGGMKSAASWSADSSFFLYTIQTQDEMRLYIASYDLTFSEPLFDVTGNGYGEFVPIEK